MASSAAAAASSHPCRKSVQAMRSWDAPWCEPGPRSRWPGQGVRAHFMRKNAWRRGVATVWPEACVGGGQPLPRTTSMSMPMTQNGAQPGDGRELAALLAIGPDARARVRILVVDDEHTLRESCAGVLRHEGYDVTVCSRGQDALDLLKRRAFDVVRSEEHTSELQSLAYLVCRLLLEKKKNNPITGYRNYESSHSHFRELI